METDVKNLLELLEYSHSLSINEKKRIIEAIPTISQTQIYQLIKAFEEENIEWEKLIKKDKETEKALEKLKEKAKEDWKKLQEEYQ